VTVVRPGGVVTGKSGRAPTDRRLVEAAALALARRRSTVVSLGGEQYFLEVFPTRPRLVIFGAVQVALPLVRFAKELGYRTVVVDARAAFATRERFPDADELHVGWPDEVAGRIALGPDDSVVILTHDPKLDEPAIVAAVRAGCGYVGAIGSRKTQAARRKRLADVGLSSDEIEALRAPIGLDLGGRDPAETALAIIAEVVATRNAATGRPLAAKAAEERVATRAG
jgi:xanthine dehydrogenase accessory factor